MKTNSSNCLYYSLIFLITLYATSCHKESATTTADNHRPVANAGFDQQIILPENTTVLDGTGSRDPDKDITDYEWTKIAGPAAFTLSVVPGKEEEVLVADMVEGDYDFELTVTDARGLFSRDTVQVSVLPEPPPPPSCDESGRPIVHAQLVPFNVLSYRRYGWQ